MAIHFVKEVFVPLDILSFPSQACNSSGISDSISTAARFLAGIQYRLVVVFAGYPVLVWLS